MNTIVYSHVVVATVEGTAHHLINKYFDQKDV